MPKTFFHWSQKPLDIFLNDAPRFEVHTQGRAWVIDKINRRKGATSRPKSVSLVVFREQAAKLFVKHPAISWLGWKRIFGQYWSEEIYKDLVWAPSDAFQCGRVLVVRKAQFADIDDPPRLRDQIRKRHRIIAGEIAGAFLILVILILASLGHDILPTSQRDWLFSLMPDVEQQTSDDVAEVARYLLVASPILFFGAVWFMKVIRVPNPNGSKWEVEAELACAMAKADEAQAAEGRLR